MDKSELDDDSGRDRRRFPRSELPETNIEIQDGIHLFSAKVVDHSGGGIGIKCPRPLSVEDSVNILVKKEPEQESPFKAIYSGEVCWSRKQLDSDQFRSGIQIHIPREHLDD